MNVLIGDIDIEYAKRHMKINKLEILYDNPLPVLKSIKNDILGIWNKTNIFIFADTEFIEGGGIDLAFEVSEKKQIEIFIHAKIDKRSKLYKEKKAHIIEQIDTPGIDFSLIYKGKVRQWLNIYRDEIGEVACLNILFSTLKNYDQKKKIYDILLMIKKNEIKTQESIQMLFL